MTNSSVAYPLAGTSDIDLARLGVVSLAYSPSATDPNEPGVQGVRDAASKTYSLIFGNAFSHKGVQLDAGVYFHIARATPRGIFGRWNDGGRRAPRAHGYFCASRLDLPGVVHDGEGVVRTAVESLGISGISALTVSGYRPVSDYFVVEVSGPKGQHVDGPTVVHVYSSGRVVPVVPR